MDINVQISQLTKERDDARLAAGMHLQTIKSQAAVIAAYVRAGAKQAAGVEQRSNTQCTFCNGAGGWGAGEDAEECGQCNGTGDQPPAPALPRRPTAVMAGSLSEPQRVWIINDAAGEHVMMCPEKPTADYLIYVTQATKSACTVTEYLLFPADRQPAMGAGSRIAVLEAALKFYADSEHFHLHQPDSWDTVSGEPTNFQEDENNTATVEDGTVARMALAGTPLTDDRPTASGAVGLSPCPCCPQAIRNLHAVAHNICTRTPHIHDGELKRAVDQVKPLMDAHFADPEHSHGAALAPHRGEGGKHG